MAIGRRAWPGRESICVRPAGARHGPTLSGAAADRSRPIRSLGRLPGHVFVFPSLITFLLHDFALYSGAE